MSDTTSSPNMSMPVPNVGIDPGPNWANDLNACLSIIDQHDHSPGRGVPIPNDSIEVSTNFQMSNNNLTGVRSVRFNSRSSALTAASDIGAIYELGNDLYFRNGAGLNIQITNASGISGTNGSIVGLVPPASAIYVPGNQTFVWQSGANIPANMDGGSFIFRNITAGSNGITMSAPPALSSNYTLTLPALPISQKIMTLDNTGLMAAPYSIDGITLAITSNVIGVKALGIDTAQLANGAVTTPKLANNAVTFAKLQTPNLTSSVTTTGGFSTNSTSYVNVTNLAADITLTGTRPVMVMFIPSNATQECGWGVNRTHGTAPVDAKAVIKLIRGVTDISTQVIQTKYDLPGVVTTNAMVLQIPPGAVFFIDSSPPAGLQTYKIQALTNNVETSITVTFITMNLWEMPA